MTTTWTWWEAWRGFDKNKVDLFSIDDSIGYTRTYIHTQVAVLDAKDGFGSIACLAKCAEPSLRKK